MTGMEFSGHLIQWAFNVRRKSCQWLWLERERNCDVFSKL